MAALPGLADEVREPASARQKQVRLTPEQVGQLLDDYQAGSDMNSLARTSGVHRHSVRTHLLGAGVELRQVGLSGLQVDEALRLYVGGLSLAKIGEQLGCDHSTVGRALKRRGLVLRKPWGSI